MNPRKRKPPIGLGNFLLAILVGLIIGAVCGYFIFQLGYTIIQIGSEWTLIYIPDYAGTVVVWWNLLAFGVVGAGVTGTLLYKWEKFRFFIG